MQLEGKHQQIMGYSVIWRDKKHQRRGITSSLLHRLSPERQREHGRSFHLRKVITTVKLHFNFGHSRGGLKEGGSLERGGYSQNQVTRVYMLAFQFF